MVALLETCGTTALISEYRHTGDMQRVRKCVIHFTHAFATPPQRLRHVETMLCDADDICTALPNGSGL